MKTFNYDRWKLTVDLDRWIEVAKLQREELYDMLGKIFGCDISLCRTDSCEQSKNVYEVKAGNNTICHMVFEFFGRTNFYVVAIYDDCHENYNLRIKPKRRLELSSEVFYFFKNGIDSIMFNHSSDSGAYGIYCLSTIIIGGDIDITFTTDSEESVCKLVNDYLEIFDVITKYRRERSYENCEKSMISELFEAYKVILSKIDSKVCIFRVEVKCLEHLTYGEGSLKSMRMQVNGHFVSCYSSDTVKWEWQDNLVHWETFSYIDGKVFDGRMKEVTDDKLKETIISNIAEGKAKWDEFQKQLKSN